MCAVATEQCSNFCLTTDLWSMSMWKHLIKLYKRHFIKDALLPPLLLTLFLVPTLWHRVVEVALTSALTFRSWFQTRRLWKRKVKVRRWAACRPAPLTRGQNNIRTRWDHFRRSKRSHRSPPLKSEGLSCLHRSYLPYSHEFKTQMLTFY